MPTLIDIEYGTVAGSSSLRDNNGLHSVVKTKKRTYIVLGDALTDTEETILLTSGLPVVAVTTLSGCVCSEVITKEVDTVIHPVTGVKCGKWEVDVTYTSDMKKKDTLDPLLQPPVVEDDYEGYSEHLERDVINGRRIVTRADEPLFCDVENNYGVIRVSRYERYPYNRSTTTFFGNKINSTPFFGNPRGSVLMYPVKTTEEEIEDVKYIKATYTFKVKQRFDPTGNPEQDSWQAHLLHQGYKYRKTKDGIPEIYFDKKGQPELTNLDYNGLLLKDTSGDNLAMGLNTSWVRPESPDLHPSGVLDYNTAWSADRTLLKDSIGSTLVIYDSFAGFTAGDYLIVDYVFGPAGTGFYWVTDRPCGTVGATGAAWTLHPAPYYLYFNRYFYSDFNALNLDWNPGA